MGTKREVCRNWALLLYPDCEEHMVALDRLANGDYDYIGILHDKDVEDDGALKKAHYHICLRYPNAVVKGSVARSLGIQENYLGKINNWKKATQYLIHYNDDDKYQYDISELIGSRHLIDELIKTLSTERDEVSKVIDIIDYVDSSAEMSYTRLVRWSAENGCWDVLRRGGAIFCRVVEEHNNAIYSFRDRDGFYPAFSLRNPFLQDGKKVENNAENC